MDKSKISAVVLAGGFGTRLSPLTDTVPKPMMKVLNKSVLSLTVEKLMKMGIQNITVSAFYKWEKLQQHMKEYPKVKVVHEAVPMGTAGGTKMCADENAQNILVLSGDGVFDFDLDSVLEFHEKKGADITMVTTRGKNPTSFGVVVCDEEGNVSKIMEKPPWRKVVTNVINTGIYVLSQKVLEQIPDGVFYDFSKDLFPKLLKNGYKVTAVQCDGYWCDMGSLEAYLECNLDGCFGRIKSLPNTANQKKGLSQVGIDAKDDVFMGKDVSFGCNVVLEKGVVCGDNCAVKSDCILSASVLGNNVRVGEGSGIYKAIIGDGAVIEANCIIQEGCVIEQGCVIKEGTVLEKNTSVNTKGQMFVNESMKKQKNIFRENGVAVFTGEEKITEIVSFANALSRALKESGKLKPSASVIACNGDEKISEAFMSALANRGIKVMYLEDAKEHHAVFADIYYPCDVTVCISDFADGVSVLLLSDGGAVQDEIERKISKDFAYNRDAYRDKAPEKITTVTGTDELCVPALKSAVRKMLGENVYLPYKINVTCSEKTKQQAHCLQKAVDDFVYETRENERGKEKITVIFEEKGIFVKQADIFADNSHILACVFDNTNLIGINKVYLDGESPEILNYILRKNNCSFGYVQDDGRTGFFENALGLLVSRDMIFAVCALLCISHLDANGLSGVVSRLPEFEIFSDIYTGYSDRALCMERLCRLYGLGDRKGDGVTVKLADGNVTVIPDRIRGFKMIGEAVNMETAKEICFRVAKSIDAEEKNNHTL